MKNFISYKNSSPLGDLISYMAGIRQMHKETGKKAVIYQRLDMVGVGYNGSIHPFSNDEGEPVCFNRYMFDMASRLIKSQEYVDDYAIFKGEEVDFDFDKTRLETFTNQPLGSLNRWPFYVFPQMATDLSIPYLDVPKDKSYSEKIIVNFTQRYRNHFVNYFFLKNYSTNLIFAGTQKERDLFCSQWDLDIPLLQVDDFYDYAKVINGCKFFIGNQSMGFQIAEALKVPRLLEIFQLMPNVIPVGGIAYDYYHQKPLEYYFDKLLNR